MSIPSTTLEPLVSETDLISPRRKFRAHPSPVSLIRAVLNRELGSAKSTGALTTTLEAERERTVTLIYQLYQLAVRRVKDVPLQESAIVKVAACLRRLQLVGHRDLDEIYQHCVERSIRDHEFLHERDSLQLRHLYSFSRDLPDHELGMMELAELEQAVVNDRPLDVKRWFLRLSQRLDRLSRDVPAYIRGYVWPQLMLTCTASFTLHFELAVLDVRLLGPIGWENSRGFYSHLKSLYGRDCSRFVEFMDRREIRDALEYFTLADDAANAEHFEIIEYQFTPKNLESLRASVSEAAAQPVPPPALPAPIPSESSWIKRLLTGGRMARPSTVVSAMSMH